MSGRRFLLATRSAGKLRELRELVTEYGLEGVGLPAPRTPAPHADVSSRGFATLRMNAAKVAISPGSGFGPGGEGFIRFALVENEQRIQQAVRHMRRGLTKLG